MIKWIRFKGQLVLLLFFSFFVCMGFVQGQPKDEFRVATVRQGDSLSYLSFKFYHKYNEHILNAILSANPEIKNPDMIFVGQKVKFPRLSSIEAVQNTGTHEKELPATTETDIAIETIPPSDDSRKDVVPDKKTTDADTDISLTPETEKMTAYITFLSGHVELARSGTDVWEAAIINQSLYEGDRIRVKDYSKAELIIENKSVIRLSENSNLTISTLAKEPEKQVKKMEFYLSLGRIWNKAKKLMHPESEYHVNTPTALSGIRGTVYSIDILANNDIRFKTYSGEIDVWNPAGQDRSSEKKDSGNVLMPPTEISGPKEVSGPHEVSMMAWKNIVVGKYEQLLVTKDGKADKHKFNPEEDRKDQWVDWNTQRDADLDNADPFL